MYTLLLMAEEEDEDTPLLQPHSVVGDMTRMYIYSSTNLKSVIDERPPYKISTFLFGLIVACSGFLYGWDQGVMGGVILLLVEAFDMSSIGESIVISAALFSAIITTLFAGELSDRFGRRVLIISAYSLFIVGYVMVCSAYSFEVLVIGRVIFGLGIGFGSSTIPLYISETASTELRGGLVTLFVLGFSVGIFVGSLAAGAVSGNDEGWRWLYISMVPTTVLVLLGFVLLPESPRWLYQQGEHVDAFMAFKMMRSNRRVAYKEIKHLLKSELKKGMQKVGENSPGDIKVNDGNINSNSTNSNRQSGGIHAHAHRAFLLGCSLHICQQTMGISAVQYFITDVLNFAGFDRATAIWLGAAVNATKLVSAVVGIFYVDNLGRRPLVLGSVSVAAISLVALACAYAYAMDLSNPIRVPAISDPSSLCDNYDECVSCLSNSDCGLCYERDYITCVGIEMINNTASSSQCPSSRIELDQCPGKLPNTASWLVFTALCMFGVSAAPGIGPLPWTINSEIYPAEVRGPSISIAAATNWATNFVVCISFLWLLNIVGGPILFLIYATIGAFFFLFFYIYLPETKGKSLEDIGMAFENVWGEAKNEDDNYLKTPLVVQSVLMMFIITGTCIFVIWTIFKL